MFCIHVQIDGIAIEREQWVKFLGKYSGWKTNYVYTWEEVIPWYKSKTSW